MLPIAPSVYYGHRVRERDPEKRPARAKRDEEMRGHIERVWRDNFEVYGVRKVWGHLTERQNRKIARCTVRRLMRDLGLSGAVRGGAFKVTTVADDTNVRPPDLVSRQFEATRPNQLWVADLTYVATWRGFAYVAFVVDACPALCAALQRGHSHWRAHRSGPR